MPKTNGQMKEWIEALHCMINVCNKVPTRGGPSGGVIVHRVNFWTFKKMSHYCKVVRPLLDG